MLVYSFCPKHLSFLLTKVLIILGLILPASAAEVTNDVSDDVAVNLVEALGLDIMSLIKENLDEDNGTAKLADLLGSYLETRIIAAFVLGRYWRLLDSKDRSRFVSTLPSEIASYYYDYLMSWGDGGSFQIGRVIHGGDKKGTIVRMHVSAPKRKGKHKMVLDWRVRQSRDGKVRVVDMKLDGISLVISLRSVYISKLDVNGGDIDSIIPKKEK